MSMIDFSVKGLINILLLLLKEIQNTNKKEMKLAYGWQKKTEQYFKHEHILLC